MQVLCFSYYFYNSVLCKRSFWQGIWLRKVPEMSEIMYIFLKVSRKNRKLRDRIIATNTSFKDYWQVLILAADYKNQRSLSWISILHMNQKENGTSDCTILPWVRQLCSLVLRREAREMLLQPMSSRTFPPRKHFMVLSDPWGPGPYLSPSAGTLALWLIPTSRVLLSRSRPAASPSPFGDHVLYCNRTYLGGRVLECQLCSQRPQWQPEGYFKGAGLVSKKKLGQDWKRGRGSNKYFCPILMSGSPIYSCHPTPFFPWGHNISYLPWYFPGIPECVKNYLHVRDHFS